MIELKSYCAFMAGLFCVIGAVAQIAGFFSKSDIQGERWRSRAIQSDLIAALFLLLRLQ